VEPVFAQDHAQTNNIDRDPIQSGLDHGLERSSQRNKGIP
jgi:hypothetical protein